MFARHRLFRLMVDEVEKSLILSDMEIAEQYAGLVEDEAIRERVFSLVREEHARASAAVRDLTDGAGIGARFPNLSDRFRLLRPQIDRINRLQVDLLREVRADGSLRNAIPLMQSMNCIAAGLGWTG
jgi:phosphoenolpyruvate carboxylase